jgi:hypothetical protein
VSGDEVPHEKEDRHDDVLRDRYDVGSRHLRNWVSAWDGTALASTNLQDLDPVFNGSVKINVV